ncbi:uncharacterized protein LOC116342884 [Contarinia nasturtii]|uniref:uncharacterized protein LOC116342884 n=1 Tax=Contarinia nasturtii TaxID=265458 RepID=UPI0012D4360F|nr:uncharacterized protein LOC116342884 [Contarinia nasturtii]
MDGNNDIEGFERRPRRYGSPIEIADFYSESDDDDVKDIKIEPNFDLTDQIPLISYQLNSGIPNMKEKNDSQSQHYDISNIKIDVDADQPGISIPLPYDGSVSNTRLIYRSCDPMHSIFTNEQYKQIIKNVTNVTHLINSLEETVDKHIRGIDSDSSKTNSSSDDESSSSDSDSSSSSSTSSVASSKDDKKRKHIRSSNRNRRIDSCSRSSLQNERNVVNIPKPTSFNHHFQVDTNSRSDIPEHESYSIPKNTENLNSDSSSGECFQPPAEKRIRVDETNQTNSTSANVRNQGESQLKNIDKTLFFNSIKAKTCQICHRCYTLMTAHYKKVHPNHEVLVSRISPEMAKDVENLNRSFLTPEKNIFAAFCIFCETQHSYRLQYWIDHIRSHTGEYGYKCSICEKDHSFDRNICCGQLPNIKYPFDLRFEDLTAFMCRKCNFVQINEQNIQKHLRNEHEIEHINGHYKQIILLSALSKTLNGGHHSPYTHYSVFQMFSPRNV